MLYRHVNVLADLRLRSDHIHEFVRNTIIVNIHQSDPFYAFNAAKLMQKIRQTEFSVQVTAVLRRILRNQDQFPDPCVRHVLRLADAVFDTLGPVWSAYRRVLQTLFFCI